MFSKLGHNVKARRCSTTRLSRTMTIPSTLDTKCMYSNVPNVIRATESGLNRVYIRDCYPQNAHIAQHIKIDSADNIMWCESTCFSEDNFGLNRYRVSYTFIGDIYVENEQSVTLRENIVHIFLHERKS